MKQKSFIFKFCVVLMITVLCMTGCQFNNPFAKVEVDYSLEELPEFVNSIDECKDTGKKYVLPDGYLYSYESVFVSFAENQIPLSTDEDGNIFNEKGYLNNTRIRSTLELDTFDCSFVTGFIPIKSGDVIYLSDGTYSTDHARASALNIGLYDGSKQSIAQFSMVNVSSPYFSVIEKTKGGFVTVLKIEETDVLKNVAYIRFTLLGEGEQQIISVNQPFDEGYDACIWSPVEKYYSASWAEEISATIDSVNAIELADESAVTSFLFTTDIHLRANEYDDNYTEQLGRISAQIMRTCNIPFFATGGDNCTQSTGHEISVFKQNMRLVLKHLSPIPQQNILLTVGNHDGATGSAEENGETLYYRHQLSNKERSSVFFGWQRETNPDKVFDSDGTYYYLDDANTKTRYIMLNSFWSQWKGKNNGFVEDVQHSFFNNPLFGQTQLKWFAEEALDLPEGYAAVIITHSSNSAKDFELFKNIVDAYSGKTTYEGQYTGAVSWQSSSISVDYTDTKGEIVAVFQGHEHKDMTQELFADVPCINVTTASANWDVRNDYELERVKGTSTEFAVDVVVVDRAARKIHMVRLGAGYDRVVDY